MVELGTYEEVERFLKLNDEIEEETKFLAPANLNGDDFALGEQFTGRKYKTRVIVFIYSMDDWDEELEAIKKSARD